jgi:hypothetical protein
MQGLSKMQDSFAAHLSGLYGTSVYPEIQTGVMSTIHSMHFISFSTFIKEASL